MGNYPEVEHKVSISKYVRDLAIYLMTNFFLPKD